MNGLSGERLARALAERRPAAVVLPNFHVLNSLALAGSRTFERRRYGFAASVIEGIAVSTAAPTIHTLHVKVANQSASAITIAPVSYITDRREERRMPDITVPAGADGWIAIEIDKAAPARAVLLNLPVSALWIGGIAVNAPPRPGIHWPWDSGAMVRWSRRNVQETPLGLEFSAAALFRYWGTLGDSRIPLARGAQIVSDESGIVFVATAVPAR